MTVVSITGSSTAHLTGHKVTLGLISPATAHWTDVCFADEWLDSVKTVAKPTLGCGDIAMSGNGGKMAVETRNFVSTDTIVDYTRVGWRVTPVYGLGRSDATVMSLASGDFCCCRAFSGVEI